MLKRLMILAFFCIAIVPMPAQHQVGGKQPAQQRQRNSDQAADTTPHDDTASYYQQKASDTPQGWHKLVTWPEGITASAIVLTFAAIIWQAVETRRAVRVSRDAIILQYRPKVILRSLGVYSPTSAELEVKLTIRNSGATTANIQNSAFQIQWIKNGQPEPRPDDKIKAFKLKPGKSKTLRFMANEFAGAFGAEEIMHRANSRIRRDAVLLSCNGVIVYLDDIGTRRETGIARICDFATRQFIPVDDAEREYSD